MRPGAVLSSLHVAVGPSGIRKVGAVVFFAELGGATPGEGGGDGSEDEDDGEVVKEEEEGASMRRPLCRRPWRGP